MTTQDEIKGTDFTAKDVVEILEVHRIEVIKETLTSLAQEIEKKVVLCEAKINKSLIDNGGWTFFGEKEDLRELKVLGEVLAIINSHKTEGGIE